VIERFERELVGELDHRRILICGPDRLKPLAAAGPERADRQLDPLLAGGEREADAGARGARAHMLGQGPRDDVDIGEPLEREPGPRAQRTRERLEYRGEELRREHGDDHVSSQAAAPRHPGLWVLRVLEAHEHLSPARIVTKVETHPDLGAATRRGQEFGPVGERVDQRQADPQVIARLRELLEPAAPVAHGRLDLLELDVDAHRDRAALAAVGVIDGVVTCLAHDRLEVLTSSGRSANGVATPPSTALTNPALSGRLSRRRFSTVGLPLTTST